MTENQPARQRPPEGPPDAQPAPQPDPTAEFLAGVRAEETPWRTDRSADAPPSHETYAEAAQRFQRTRGVARALGQAAPYVQLGALGAYAATEAFDDDDYVEYGDATGFGDGGFGDFGSG